MPLEPRPCAGVFFARKLAELKAWYVDMKILFVHQNFPGQFKYLAPLLARLHGYEVVALTMNDCPSTREIRVVRYQVRKSTGRDTHPWVTDIETKVIRGEAAFYAGMSMRTDGFVPDLIIAHPGWGESLFLKELWPTSKIIIYAEYHYEAMGADVGFDPEFPLNDPGYACRLRLKNANNLLHFDLADAAVSPTTWQRDRFPYPFRSKIHVIHDGIDTQALKPNPNVVVDLDGVKLTKSDEVVTFVARSLEPYRGYHVFMRSLPGLMASRPNARIIIIGSEGVSYGAKPPPDKTWKQIYLDEVKEQIDMSRVHFVGRVNYSVFVKILQVSTVHVYLSYPFVLSWSMLEAMACGCAIVASDTAPVMEVVKDGQTGVLVDFFKPETVANAVVQMLDRPEMRKRMGERARALIVEHYDLQAVCLPAWGALIRDVLRMPK